MADRISPPGFRKTLLRFLSFTFLMSGIAGLSFYAAYKVRQNTLQSWLLPEINHPYFDITTSKANIALPQGYQTDFTCYSGTPMFLPVQIRNYSAGRLSSGLEIRKGPGKPVNLGHRFFSRTEQKLLWEGPRYFFRPPVRRAESPVIPSQRQISLAIRCPEAPGEYSLSVELVQEGVAWQSDIVPASEYISMLQVTSINLADFTTGEVAGTHFPAGTPFSQTTREQSGISHDVLIMAKRLLDTTSRTIPAEFGPLYVSDAGSNYPMVWVRDMATIHKATGLFRPGITSEGHWSELFFKRQDALSGQIPDWVALDQPLHGKWSDKNDIQSDQELWLLDSILTDLLSGRLSMLWLDKKTSGKSHIQRMMLAMDWLLKNRLNQNPSCIRNGHTADWGDVGLMGHNSETSTRLRFNPGRVCGIFLQALFIKVSDQFIALAQAREELEEYPVISRLPALRKEILATTEKLLWMPGPGHYRMHIHTVSPAKKLPDEKNVFALGGQVMAFEAGLLKGERLKQVHDRILSLKTKYDISTIGSVILPPYPDGTFSNPIMGYFQYQNGGQWDWFGARAALMLEAAKKGSGQKALHEIAKKVIRNKTFYEWDRPDGSPGAGPHFRAGAAAYVLGYFGIWEQPEAGSLSGIQQEKTYKHAL